MVILVDIGNTHTHVARANSRRIVARRDLLTRDWFQKNGHAAFLDFARGHRAEGIAVCSVVPRATPRLKKVARAGGLSFFELNATTVSLVGINYPRPMTIGPDRLANAAAVRCRFGAPAVVVDFGTAVTFDVVDGRADYVGGIIAPGLAAMTDYLHEKTALLPKIEIREVSTAIGKSTEEAMRIGAVHGYRGMVRELLAALRKQLRAQSIPVIATGGYAELVASKLSEVTAIDPDLTLEGLRLEWLAHRAAAARGPKMTGAYNTGEL